MPPRKSRRIVGKAEETKTTEDDKEAETEKKTRGRRAAEPRSSTASSEWLGKKDDSKGEQSNTHQTKSKTGSQSKENSSDFANINSDFADSSVIVLEDSDDENETYHSCLVISDDDEVDEDTKKTEVRSVTPEEEYEPDEEENNDHDYNEDEDEASGEDEDSSYSPQAASSGARRFNVEAATLDKSAMTTRMQGIFESGLAIHLSGEEMEACRGVDTKLFPHQRVALAWMFRHENEETDGMLGGILADDMGLGKSLTVISLILTNHWDGRPLVKPELGYVRPPFAMTGGKGGKGKAGGAFKAKGASADFSVGAKATTKKTNIGSVFEKFKRKADDMDEKENKFTFGSNSSKRQTIESSDEDLTDEEADEFDNMSKKKSTHLKERKENIFKREPTPEPSDDENEGMTAEEMMESMIPTALDGTFDLDAKLNLDGFLDDSDSDVDVKGKKPKRLLNSSDTEDEDIEPEKPKNVKRKKSTKSEAAKKKRSFENAEESDASLPDLDEDAQMSSKDMDRLKENQNNTSCDQVLVEANMQDNEETGLKLIIPPREPATRAGRRRATLLVCPTSLLSHWLDQLHNHLHKSVDIKVKVHHGQNKAFYAADLEGHDLVLTTYGTLAAEFVHGERSGGPLLRAKWLRVVLDEGHMIKNHNSKSHKAAAQLDALRRWVVTGTPIQNNMMELWSLVSFLRFGMYAGRQQMQVFKRQIEKPCRSGNPRGFERLQVLMDAICLRRSKSDKKPDGSLLVPLPSKTILIRKVDMDEEERLCYGIFHKQASDIVTRYHKHGRLLQNYAHIFAMMIRLRQLCCHRKLIRDVDWGDVMKDKAGLKRQLESFLAEEEERMKEGAEAGTVSEEEKRLVGQLREMIRSGMTDDCSICFDDLTAPVITPCAHVFCRGCIETSIDFESRLKRAPACPLCRRSPLEKKQLLEAGQDDEDEGKEKGEATLADMKDIVVNVSSSKVNAVLREMKRIGRDRPEDKMVVVSQFTSFLNVLQPLLQEEDFSYVRLDGTMAHQDRSRAVACFQETHRGSPKVMLLSLRAGGVGLNLTSANHVLLLDPAWNPASEWQCFDRTHRLGQTKDVTVYKFVTRNSIEEKMVDIQKKKKDLISGAFHMDSEERRRERVNDIRNIFRV